MTDTPPTQPEQPAPPWIKRFLPKTLLGRSVLIIVIPLVLLQVVSAGIFYETHWSKITRRLAVGVAGDVAAVIDMMRHDPTPTGLEWAMHLAAGTMSFSSSFHEGDVLEQVTTDIEGHMENTLLWALDSYVAKPVWIDSESLRRHVIIHVQLPTGVLRLTTPRKRLFSSTTYVFVLWMVGTSLILFAIATLFMRNQVKPIRRLAFASDEFGKGRDVEKFKPEGAAEVRLAAQAFIAMRERIQRQIGQRTDMLAGVSHDLRTPLTRMKLQLALLEGQKGVEDLKGDIAEMEYMLDEYLAFARGEGTEKPVDTNLSDLLREAVTQAGRKGAHVDLHLEEDITIPIRPNAFRRSITNLVDNALRYGENVAIRAGRRDDMIEIAVDDDGPGIPEEKRDEVFRPFVRLETSRNQGTGGVGLGLSIARDVVRGHGGDMALDQSPLGGLRAIVRMPV
ncbi:MAG: HAMP domain-containing protein [Rhodospirillales bacterium]|nr:HAMP domain-containing protein [Rhodospirillales bacterium]MBT4038428.1 HAMP domain-containing protein [Rhodospirillales bacterium]MBT4625703.1 HAMP domain-containing protein [Rhodospirillales bacterium]MBT5352369.1 HAMP domain-containing protein [Rhodospirillales bacterium]MBT5519815.1 HAMP domain-containing protein [Rhodospirillales bacterium]